MAGFRIMGVVSVLAMASALAAAEPQGSLSQTVSGSFVDTSIDTNGDGVAANHFVGAAKGSGSPSYVGLQEVQFTPTGECEPGEVEGIMVAYSIVRRYGNGDLLYSDLVDGTFCFNPAAGTANVKVNAEIIGGTGRFEGATGSYLVEYEVRALLPDPTGGIAHGSFDGTVTGSID